ncbi:MAG: carbamoyl-phosphate synthase large subunit [Magnetococcales bacterium]|nr:carbamoyl-phosphate synthase large subunit [Magnetococcales bacterium]
MPKRTDIKRILLIGAGPIVIGQACEFDYSGAQACKALKEDGFEVVLVNSNPATIMTDPELADRTYVEPLTLDSLACILEREKPDAVLPTMGGQTALNLALALADAGLLEKHGVELIGASREAIAKAEDREQFKKAMTAIGMDLPLSGFAHSLEEALEIQKEIGYPTILRPGFTLGGTGGGVANNREEFITLIERGLAASPNNEVLVEESLIGWKEFEMEVVRDMADNAIIVCSIENFDPMGVHTGDSITVAPAQTLTDKEYQDLRDASIAVLREIGVDTGGSNVQFAMHPETGRLVIIEMNPRVSRSSALASKATGFPIAKVAAKLAVGFTLPEIMNDITGVTPASFEPTIDYVVTKIPRFTFEKFPQADPVLTTQMKSVGEVMSIGRTFKESVQKGLRSLETDLSGFDSMEIQGESPEAREKALKSRLNRPTPDRILYLAEGFRQGKSLEWLHDITAIDPWFLDQIAQLVEAEAALTGKPLADLSADHLRELKEKGFSDQRLAEIIQTTPEKIRQARRQLKVNPVFKRVDTCAAEFASQTAYLYSTFESECESEPSERKKIMILGGGPNRIGQGIEFDYCCVHAAFALRESGFETIMVNCNPETVSTDYDTSDRLYFEPLTFEDVMAIVDIEKPHGVIVQFGGQTPLKLANDLHNAGVPIIGTSPDAIDVAEDRERFQQLLQRIGLRQPKNGLARSEKEAIQVAREVGYPIVVRPSYVLGGRAMEIVHDESDLSHYMRTAVHASPDHPVLIDQFLKDAIEIDVDCVADGHRAVVGGIMEHIEEAGIHSGDSACSLPAYSVGIGTLEEIERQTKLLAKELKVVGLMNIQFAVQNSAIFILEVNPRASRTVPFVSKATGVPLAKVAARVMAGETLDKIGLTRTPQTRHVAVKEAVFPFDKFPGVDTLLGPEMKSTGEVMGLADTFGVAFAKAEEGAGTFLPQPGDLTKGERIFISIREEDKLAMVQPAGRLVAMGFKLLATQGTARFLKGEGIPVETVNKVNEGSPHIVDSMNQGGVALVFNTTEGKQAIADSLSLRRTALMAKIPYVTTLSGIRATVAAIDAVQQSGFHCRALQDYHTQP